MLDYLGEKSAASRLKNAVEAVISEGKDVTYDLKPTRDDLTYVGTKEMADAIIRKMSEEFWRELRRLFLLFFSIVF